MEWFRKPGVDALLDAVTGTRDDPVANVAACRKALKVLTLEETPDWASTKRSLGLAYWKKHNPEKAILHLRDALQVRTRQPR